MNCTYLNVFIPVLNMYFTFQSVGVRWLCLQGFGAGGEMGQPAGAGKRAEGGEQPHQDNHQGQRTLLSQPQRQDLCCLPDWPAKPSGVFGRFTLSTRFTLTLHITIHYTLKYVSKTWAPGPDPDLDHAGDHDPAVDPAWQKQKMSRIDSDSLLWTLKKSTVFLVSKQKEGGGKFEFSYTFPG